MKLDAPRLDVLVWTAVYGGLAVVAIGIALVRNGAGYGAAVIAAGVACIVLGAVLLCVRARLRAP